MVVLVIVATLAVLAAATLIGTAVIERRYPPQGRFVDVPGARMHVVDLGPRDGKEPPLVLIHGATSNLGTMRVPLGDELAKTRRVILIDRPGHGWSTRDDLAVSAPSAQARQIIATLDGLGVRKAVFVVHSLAGALGVLLPLDFPDRVAGLVLLAPVAYPWVGGVGDYNKLVTMPVIGPLLAHTVTLPLGLALTEPGARSVFRPQTMPDGYVAATSVPLVLRPAQFRANAFDLVTLKAAVTAQSPRYHDIAVPTVIITGDADNTVYPDVHSRPLARAVPDARLVVLPGVGHMIPATESAVVIREIDALMARIAASAAG